MDQRIRLICPTEILILNFAFSLGLITFFFSKYSTNIVLKSFSFYLFVFCFVLSFCYLSCCKFSTFLLVFICAVIFNYLYLVDMKKCLLCKNEFANNDLTKLHCYIFYNVDLEYYLFMKASRKTRSNLSPRGCLRCACLKIYKLKNTLFLKKLF